MPHRLLHSRRLIDIPETPAFLTGDDTPLGVRIATLAAAQLGVVSHSQLLEAGMSASQIKRWIHAGRLHRIHPRAYAVGHPALSYAGRVMAALTSIGGDATAAARTAALLAGYYDRGRPFVEVVSTKRHRGLDEVAIRFTRHLPAQDVVLIGPLRVTSPARTIIDLAEYCSPHQVAFAIHEARRLRHVQLRSIERLAREHRHRRGAPTLSRALAMHGAGSAGTRSPAEDEFLRMLIDAGLPEPFVNVHVHVGRRKYELDFHWPGIRLNIEVDGGEHELPSRRASDRARDENLRAAGWHVVRIPPSFLEAGIDIAREWLARS